VTIDHPAESGQRGRGPRLGDRVTVTDGVEVRNRAVAAQPTFVTDPETGTPGIHAWLYAADGSLLDDRHHVGAATMIALENVFPDKITKVVLRAGIDAQGPVELGVFGAGNWVVTVGSRSLHFSPRASGKGFAEEIIPPPTESTVVDLDGPAIVEATVELEHSPGVTQAEIDNAQDAAVSLTAMGTFGLIGRRRGAPRRSSPTRSPRRPPSPWSS
jgi:beta-glucosidase